MFSKLFRQKTDKPGFLDRSDMAIPSAIFRRLNARVASDALDLGVEVEEPNLPDDLERLSTSLPEAVGTLLGIRMWDAVSGIEKRVWDNSDRSTLQLALIHSASRIAVQGAIGALQQEYPDLSRRSGDEGVASLFAMHYRMYGDEWSETFASTSAKLGRELIQSDHPVSEKIRQSLISLGVGEVQEFEIGDPADERQSRLAKGIASTLLKGLN